MALLLLLGLVGCGPRSETCRVTLVADGTSREVLTHAPTVRDVLVEARITLEAEDRVTPVEPSLVKDGMTIRVVRVETRTETENRQIPFDRRTVRDTSVAVGTTQLLEAGITGAEELTYRVVLEDGVEVDRRLVRRVTRREPRTEVILIGAQLDQSPTAITGTIAYIADHNAWAMRRTSANDRRITHSGDLDGRVFDLSADGSHLLFTRAPTDTEESALISTIWVLDVSVVGAEPVRVAVDNFLWAAWEPGCNAARSELGCRIAYATGSKADTGPGWQGSNDLWLAQLRPETGELMAEREVLEASDTGSYAWWGTTYAWSPDGSSLAYARAHEIGVVRAQDGQSISLARFAPYRTYGPWAWTPSLDWSPDGEFIVTVLYGSDPGGEAPEGSPVFDIWALAVDGTLAARLAGEVGMWSTPTFAPKAEYIAFGRARDPYASQTSRYDIHLMDRDGSDPRLIFPAAGEMGLQHPAVSWGPKGGQLIVIYQENLYLIRLPEGEIHQLTHKRGVTAVRWR